MRKTIIGAVGVGLLLGLASADAQAVPPDRGVEKKLKKSGLRYDIDADNDFKLLMEISADRTQLVFVRSKVHSVGRLEIREVFSPVMAVPPEGLPAELSTDLMLRNGQTILGSWVLWGDPSSPYLVFNVQVPADLSRKELRDVIEVVALTADPVEQELTGVDEF